MSVTAKWVFIGGRADAERHTGAEGMEQATRGCRGKVNAEHLQVLLANFLQRIGRANERMETAMHGVPWT